jgi:hypothetical protein
MLCRIRTADCRGRYRAGSSGPITRTQVSLRLHETTGSPNRGGSLASARPSSMRSKERSEAAPSDRAHTRHGPASRRCDKPSQESGRSGGSMPLPPFHNLSYGNRWPYIAAKWNDHATPRARLPQWPRRMSSVGELRRSTDQVI